MLFAGILCLQGATAFAQLLHPPVVQPYAASVSLSRFQPDAFSFQTNPATLHLLRRPHLGISGVQPFSLPGLASGGLSFAFPAGNTRFGGFVQHHGGTSFHQTGVNFSVAQSLGTKGSLGAAFYYRSVAVAGYGAMGMLGAGLGGLVQLSEGLQAGVYLFRPASARGKEKEERLAGYYSAGLGYDLSPQVFLSAHFFQTEKSKPEVQASISYRVVPQISARMGIQSGTKEFFAGGGFIYRKCQLHIFTSLHPRLGFSPGLQLLWGQNNTGE